MPLVSISDDMRRFILLHITSIPYLEAMLLMRGDPEHQWDASQMAKRLFINDSKAGELLSELHLAGIVEVTSKKPFLYRFHPKTDTLKKTLDQLAEVYSTHLVEVTNLIHSNINKKAQKFADAFIWRKDS